MTCKVVYLGGTHEPERMIWLAAKQCKYPYPIDELSDNYDGTAQAYIRRIIYRLGHVTIAEHASITFGISGISRACSHQLVRQRIGTSFCQQSQRSVSVEESGYLPIYPPDSSMSQEAMARLKQSYADAYAAYTDLVRLGVRKEDARMVLPQATNTSLVVTMTYRALLHFLHERLDPAAQQEIRELAGEMHTIACTLAPSLFTGCTTCASWRSAHSDCTHSDERDDIEHKLCSHWRPAIS